ncbi:MAG TPA: DnaB-like helicase C-terminal domain-containing protein [Isosphaeraceae bacterium]|jgi:replicative DNA helicase
MNEGRYQSASDILDDWRDSVLSGAPPTLYHVGDGELSRLEIGPGLVTLFGGAAGAGKTALVMQLVMERLLRTPDLRALICNVEMPPSILLDRQLDRLSGIDAEAIRHRRLGGGNAEAVGRGTEALERLADRLAFVRPPFSLANVAESADAFGASLIVIDYIQRVGAPGEHGDRRGAVDATMSFLRQFADAGVALFVVSAVGRSKDSKGRSSYAEGLNLASFRESSELEFGADDAFILATDEGEGESSGRVILKHLKSRHGETKDILLDFDRKRQRFTPASRFGPTPSNVGRLKVALKEAWGHAQPASEGEEW